MANLLKILINPSQTLRKKSVIINKTDLGSKELKQLCFAMAKTMIKADGTGLAAPQIGKNKRIIVINAKDGIIYMVNPKITKKSLVREWGQEGCLSVPDVFGKVKRNKKITCCYIDLRGQAKKITAQGLMARVIQHEIDHLDGILFIDKAKDLEKIKNL